jgi:hypothetical protein
MEDLVTGCWVGKYQMDIRGPFVNSPTLYNGDIFVLVTHHEFTLPSQVSSKITWINITYRWSLPDLPSINPSRCD